MGWFVFDLSNFVLGCIVGHFFGSYLWTVIKALASTAWQKIKAKLPSLPTS